MDAADCLKFCQNAWADGGFALEGLKDLVRVPNLSPDYDKNFFTDGLIQKACQTTKHWMESQGIKGLEVTIFDEPNKEPLLFAEIKGSSPSNGSVLIYGHLDKMPHLDPAGWGKGLSATNPVVRGPKVYGRGTNDDGFNSYSVIASVKYLQLHNLPHPRVCIVLETGEESSGVEVEHYLEKLRNKIGDVSVIMVIDGDADDYNTLWCCTSLRGCCTGVLDVQHLTAPVHSGMATGIVPDTFRIARMLLSRVENEQTGEILLPEANVEIPESRIECCRQMVHQLGHGCVAAYHPVEGAKLLHDDLVDCVISRGWKPGLAITGADGIPAVANGSNVIRAHTTLKLSLRIPPGCDAEKANRALKAVLEKDPPYGAKVTYTIGGNGNPWFGRDFKPKVNEALKAGTQAIFHADPLCYCEGASIPLCNFLQKLWPEGDILVTGCEGTDGNPHGFDENLDLPYTAKFTATVATFLNGLAK